MINRDGVLKGQVAVVTGASRGIGEAIARRYAMEGAKVVVSARTVSEEDHYLPGTITETVARINDAGGEAIAVKADLASAEDRHNLIKAAEEAFGGVDILVNNAAITYFIPVADFPEKRFRLMMDVQVWAPFELSQLVLPGMRERGHGWILNISSHAAIHPDKTLGGRGGTVYGMCKAALERFTTGLAQELYEENIGVKRDLPGAGCDARRDASQADQRGEQGAGDAGRAHGGGLPASRAWRPPCAHRPDRLCGRGHGGVLPRRGRGSHLAALPISGSGPRSA